MTICVCFIRKAIKEGVYFFYKWPLKKAAKGIEYR